MPFGIGIEQELSIVINLLPLEKNVLNNLLKDNFDYYNLLELENNGLIITSSELQNLNKLIDLIQKDILLNMDKNLFRLESDIMSKSILLQFINYKLQSKLRDIIMENINIYLAEPTFVDSNNDIIYYCEKKLSKSLKINKSITIFFETWNREILTEENNGKIEYLTIIYLSKPLEIKYFNQISKIEKDIGGLEFKNDIYNTSVNNVINEIKIKKEKVLSDFTNYFLSVDHTFINRKIQYLEDTIVLFPFKKYYKYGGDVDINVTLPYNINPETKLMTDIDLEIFKTNHIKLGKMLQYLSPLFLGCCTGAFPNSFGDNYSFRETSFRFENDVRPLSFNLDKLYNIKYDANGNVEQNKEPYYNNNHIIFNLIFEKWWSDNYTMETSCAPEFSLNRNSVKFDPSKGKYFGFEWKIIDQASLDEINKIILFMVMLIQYINNKNINFDINPIDYFNINIDISKYYNIDYKIGKRYKEINWKLSFIEEVLFEGWNTNINKYPEYITKILDIMKIKKNQLLNFPISLLDENTEYCSNDFCSEWANIKTNQNGNFFCWNCYYNSKYVPKRTIYNFLNKLYNDLLIYFNKKDNIGVIQCFYPEFKKKDFYHKMKNFPNINKKSNNLMINLMKQKDKKNFSKKLIDVWMDNENEDYDDYWYYLL